MFWESQVRFKKCCFLFPVSPFFVSSFHLTFLLFSSFSFLFSCFHLRKEKTGIPGKEFFPFFLLFS